MRVGKMLGVGKAFSGVGKVVSGLMGGVIEGMGGGRPCVAEAEGRGKGLKGVEKEVKKEFGWGLDHFVGFGGTKDSPLDGIMKILIMGV